MRHARHRRAPIYRVREGQVYNIVDFPMRSGARIYPPFTAAGMSRIGMWLAFAKRVFWATALTVAALAVLWGVYVSYMGAFEALIH